MTHPVRDPTRLGQLSKAVADLVQTSATPIVAVYVHGSWGTADQRDDSDVDLAVVGDRPLHWEEVIDLAAAIEQRLEAGRTVDLSDLTAADAVFAAQVVSSGDRVFGDSAAADLFEIKTLSTYARLNEERRDIIEDILRRGSVYAATANRIAP